MKIEVICPICEKVFKVFPSVLKKTKHPKCSQRCNCREMLSKRNTFLDKNSRYKTGEYVDRNNRFRKNTPLKYAAWQAVKAAIRNGTLKRKQCEEPGCQSYKTHAHHEDYQKPLEVIWFCKDHHAKREKEIRGSLPFYLEK